MKNIKLIASVITGFGLVFILANLFTPRFLAPALRVESLDHPMNLLIMGTDVVYDGYAQPSEKIGRSDVMLLVNLDPLLCRVNLLSIPRDTMVEIEAYGIQKINAANFYGGGELAKKTVSKLLDVPVDAYLSVDTTGIIKLIDLLGGVDVYVDRDMDYVDRAGHLNIHLKKGWHRLSGKEAHDFIRYRKDEPLGDVGRVERQQVFLEDVFRRLSNPVNVLQAPVLIGLAVESIKTDLSLREISHVMNFSRMIRPKDVKMALLPGDFSNNLAISYWLPDLPEARKLSKIYFKRSRYLF